MCGGGEESGGIGGATHKDRDGTLRTLARYGRNLGRRNSSLRTSIVFLQVHEKDRHAMKVLRAHHVLPEPLSEDDRYRLMTVTDVVRELRCCKGHIQNLIRGRVARTRLHPSVPLGRRRLICVSSLRDWIRDAEDRYGNL